MCDTDIHQSAGPTESVSSLLMSREVITNPKNTPRSLRTRSNVRTHLMMKMTRTEQAK
ncbi:hypothetical protein PISMIDRAFT_676239, partial [Pisolithus microcarpus 441]